MSHAIAAASTRGFVSPKVLLTDTDRRPYAARLAIELAMAGFRVYCISTPNHPLGKAHAIEQFFPYSPVRPPDSLLAAIRAVDPAIIFPCCDRGVQHLHELHSRLRAKPGPADPVVTLIERSLGPAASFPLVSARYELLRLAQEEDLPVPRTCLVSSVEDLKAWRDEPMPWVLKSDGTWGGRGVRIAHSLKQAEQCFLEIGRPAGLRRAIKRLVVNRDPFFFQEWLSGSKPAVIAQSYIAGRPANSAVFCWEGEILAHLEVEVVSSDGPTGPASIVRVMDNAVMRTCAERIARRLRLSGFFGLDFMIEHDSGSVYLIEMNPRCTPLCHLRLGKQHDMVGALRARLVGEPVPESVPITENPMIAYFPQAWNCKSELFQASFPDIPATRPELIRELLRPWPQRSVVYRATSFLQRAAGAALAAVKGKTTSMAENSAPASGEVGCRR